MNEKVIEIRGLVKNYELKKRKIEVLKGIDIDFEKGKFYAIRGHSGSGKSTFITIIGLLETITSGVCKINGRDIKELNDKELSDIRRSNIGFIFQDFYLDDHLRAIENVMMPMYINNDIKKEDRSRKALELLKSVGLEDRVNHFPKELSGGEKQRVAIARALANDPEIIIADEPTGNLDEESEKKIFAILKNLSEREKCIVVVSHSEEVKEYADVVYKLKDGLLHKEEI